ncbi:MAG: phosphate signaling complex protein PhoU [Bifidobacteriaceae bacterium]|jgi:phosphate transport system protein|nr:phosphate signaling complex protein PhoU [Bifidobacteriaceae bacterium]
MREIFENELNEIRNNISKLMDLVNNAINQASQSLLNGDIVLAQKIIDKDKEIDKLQSQISEDCIKSLALQQPVASDLRLLVGILHICDSLERMGDFAVHLSEFVLYSYHDKAYTNEFKNDIEQLANNADNICKLVIKLYNSREVKLLDEVVNTDNKTNDIYYKVNELVRQDKFNGSTKNAVDIALIVRFYERFGDHAIAIGRQYLYIVTGQYILQQVNIND